MKITGKNVSVLSVSILSIATVTFLAKFLKYITITELRIAATAGLNLLNGAIAFTAVKLCGMEINIDFKNKRQYLTGGAIALALSAVIAVIPALCGFSLIGNHQDFSWAVIVHDFLFYMLIIGPVEEFIFRVYLQDAFMIFFPGCRWLGVVVSAMLFGLWHIINGSVMQALFTFGIGLVFGFARYKITDCGYPGVAFGHGLYDFLNTLVRMFIV